MADREVQRLDAQVPDIPEELESVLLFALNEVHDNVLAAQADEVEASDDASQEDIADQSASEADDEVTLDGSVPFTVLAVKDKLFIETHPGNTAEECYASAEHTVRGARGATAYAFCYDGYVESDGGTRDAFIAEGGIPGADDGYAVGYLYSQVDGIIMFDGEPCYIGTAPNFMAGLKDVSADESEDIDERLVVAEIDEADTQAAEDMQAALEGAMDYLAASSPDK